ncbi:MAG TPA: (d)CMP kinase [Mycobacteriales bacterium]|nr:(d)CMP kinase [Mycobacteriales bacterium]
MIAIDGPGGSGKSTVARRLAAELRLSYLDTGATYRAVTLAALRAAVPLDDAAALTALATDLTAVNRLILDTRVGTGAVLLDGEDVSALIRGPEVTAAVSAVSAVAGVRRVLVTWQRALARHSDGCVLEGRDTGSVVVPEARVKVWLTAAPEIRAARRGAEDGVDAGADLHRRDAADASRTVDPMQPAADAIVLDSSTLGIEETVGAVLARVRQAYRLP